MKCVTGLSKLVPVVPVALDRFRWQERECVSRRQGWGNGRPADALNPSKESA